MVNITISNGHDGGKMPINRNDICAVVVTYNPDAQINERIDIIARQVKSVVIVDNNSDVDSVSLLESINSTTCEVIFNEKNYGIATALNQGMSWAITRGFKWVLTMDQDTIAERFMMDTLIEVYESVDDPGKVAVIGSNYLMANGAVGIDKPDFVEHGAIWMDRIAVITSGSLISLAVYEVIGRFRDEFFIDHVDEEYCLRARAKGYGVIVALRPAMRQFIGSARKADILVKRAVYTEHSPLRRYYMLRNYIIMFREYFRKEPMWFLRYIIYYTRMLFFICFFEKGKINTLKQTLRGVVDGILWKFN